MSTPREPTAAEELAYLKHRMKARLVQCEAFGPLRPGTKSSPICCLTYGHASIEHRRVIDDVVTDAWTGNYRWTQDVHITVTTSSLPESIAAQVYARMARQPR